MVKNQITIIDKNERKDELISFKENVKNITGFLPEELWEEMYNVIVYKSCGKNVDLLKDGTKETAARFIIKGITKVIRYDKEEYVYKFRRNGDIITDINSIFNDKLSSFTIQSITDLEWIEIEKFDLMLLLSKNNLAQFFLMNSIVSYLADYDKEFTFYRLNTAEERYEHFCKENPEIIKHAKLCDIASYLAVTQQSLSRIRKHK